MMSSKKTKKAKKKQSKKATKAKKATKQMCRIEASVIALGQIKVEGKVKYENAVIKADNIYAGQPSGGKSNIKEQAGNFRRVAKVLVLLGHITVQEGIIVRLK